jgi:hypothetical protein
MELLTVIKAGFMGFLLAVGAEMVVFMVAGGLGRIKKRAFGRVFLLGGIVAFVIVDAFLYYKMPGTSKAEAQIFLVGCLGGWVAGIFFGLTQLKPVLIKSLR